MIAAEPIWKTPADYLRAESPDEPVLLFSPATAQEAARHFLRGFPGLVTYAVKANPAEELITNLAAAGINAFDCASPVEIDLVRRLVPGAAIHYHNPVRSRAEILHARESGVRAFSIDSRSELDKLAELLPADGTEVSVRFKLPVKGAAYDFGSKFGAPPEVAAALLRAAADFGFTPSLTFHPGTQCARPGAWEDYIHAAAGIARAAGITLARLNVGGGFPSWRRVGEQPRLDAIFAVIGAATAAAFGEAAPALVCEPGRALSAESMTLATRVRALRDGGDVFLNDGIYGAMAEMGQSDVGPVERVQVLSAEGKARDGAPAPRVMFGPTCDSLDRLPGTILLPADLAEGDFVLWRGMGAYSSATASRFNGFCDLHLAMVLELDS